MENKQFFKDNKGFIYVFPFFLVITILVASLYEVNKEYIFYFITFYIISYIIAMVMQYMNHRKNLELYKQQIELINKDKDNSDIDKIRENEDFFALWTHQIKTPISALNILLQADDINKSECREELIKIEDYVNVALGYIRYDNMGNDLVLEEYSLNEIVKNVVKKYAPVFIYNRYKARYTLFGSFNTSSLNSSHCSSVNITFSSFLILGIFTPSVTTLVINSKS